jgi:hypothetical protein
MSMRIGGLVLTVVVVLATLGCGSDDNALPDRAPDATGVVAETRSLVDSSDAYYEGMGLSRSDGEPLVVGPDGDVLSVTDLADGDEIAVWVEGACAESYPVQCDVVAIHITRPAR